MTHKLNSPSKLARRRACPGSRRMEAPYADADTSSDAAIDGTHSHTLLEKCVAERSLTDLNQTGKVRVMQPTEYLGYTLTDKYGDFVVDQDRCDRVQIAVDHVNKLMDQFSVHTVRAESKVDAGPVLVRDDVDGTADIIFVAEGGPLGTYIEVIDYKDGFTPVEVEDNDQLLAYGVGALLQYQSDQTMFGLALGSDAPESALTFTAYKSVRTTVIQPRMREQGEQPVSSWDYNLDELQAWCRDTRVDLGRADDPQAPLVPGEAQCRFCDAGGVCSARAKQTLGDVSFPVVGAQALAAPLAEQVSTAEKVAAISVETLSVEQQVQLMDAAPVIRAFLKAVDAHALKQAQAGVAYPTYHLVDSLGNREWNGTEEEVAKKLKNRKLTDKDVYVRKLKSPAQIERLTKLDEKQKRRIEKDLVTRKVKGKKLEPVAAGGKASPVVPEGMFPNQTEQVSTPVDKAAGAAPSFLSPPSQ